uniref:Uncharacterized protein n=1 Tax=Timema bartmani TaxID=61472 RepID=A0A7R9FDI2_9NEOP|nr:unnamed protein product [Timema bartmani]
MVATSSQEEFLANFKNKSRFIKLLTPILRNCGILVQLASGDAGCLIVSTAIDLSAGHHELVPAMTFLSPTPKKALASYLLWLQKKVANVRRADWRALQCVAVREKSAATPLHRLSLWIVKKTWTT